MRAPLHVFFLMIDKRFHRLVCPLCLLEVGGGRHMLILIPRLGGGGHGPVTPLGERHVWKCSFVDHLMPAPVSRKIEASNVGARGATKSELLRLRPKCVATSGSGSTHLCKTVCVTAFPVNRYSLEKLRKHSVTLTSIKTDLSERESFCLVRMCWK